MFTKYKVKNKLKTSLEHIGLWNSCRRIYCIRWMIRHMRCSIAARKRREGYIDRKLFPLMKFKNTHIGERCFIVCTGPSLTLEDVEKLKCEYTFSMNSIVKLFSQTDWRPSYYLIQDAEAYLSLRDEIQSYHLNYCFMSDLLVGQLKPSHPFIAYAMDVLNHYYAEAFDKIPIFLFSDDAYSVVYHGYTVTYSALQLAVYMGFSEIYLIGCDCNFHGEKKHFIDYGVQSKRSATMLEMEMIAAYQAAKEYADSHDIKIYNATRGGNLEVFKRINFDNLFA